LSFSQLELESPAKGERVVLAVALVTRLTCCIVVCMATSRSSVVASTLRHLHALHTQLL